MFSSGFFVIIIKKCWFTTVVVVISTISFQGIKPAEIPLEKSVIPFSLITKPACFLVNLIKIVTAIAPKNKSAMTPIICTKIGLFKMGLLNLGLFTMKSIPIAEKAKLSKKILSFFSYLTEFQFVLCS